ncbi:MAG: Hsp70 family protein [Blastocatellia bacterium]|nr:Hsp70 family protein [Blastocatellia bacterium]
MSKKKYTVGIDLGTTNSAVAFVRPTEEYEESATPVIELYEIPQLVAPGEGAPCRTLPSFLYIAGQYDVAAESLWLPWNENAHFAVGTFAREQGALVPGRLVSSAKSWLCYPDVDRTAKILPWGSELGEDACSPIEASSHYLAHIRDAWNFEFVESEGGSTEARLEEQEVILTVPASFDEEARELTLQAARQAGLNNLTLIEEPLAAFYSWIVAHNKQFEKFVADKDLILICDVGGGTTDFSLIRVLRNNSEVNFVRTAVGQHLLLGGDNVDHSLAKKVEQKLGGTSRLTLDQRAALLRQCCSAKERLLESEESVIIRLAGGGSRFVGGSLQAVLTKEEVLELLMDGFLPNVELNDLPRRDRRSLLRQIGLPYEPDPAITRHLAAFLHDAATAMGFDAPVCPDAILFNGGFFKPSLLRTRLAEIVSGWFGRQPKLLSNQSLDTAVAIGAAYYGLVRREGGVKVGSGSPRTYYVGISSEAEELSENEILAVCVLPRGTEEGSRLKLESRLFNLQANLPVLFSLWSSITRHGDKFGDLIKVESDQLHAHSPLETVIRFGKRTNTTEVPVRLVADFTTVGTLELWCESQISEHKWRLQFQLRKAAPEIKQHKKILPSLQHSTVVDQENLDQALLLINEVFDGSKISSPVDLVNRLEEVLKLGRDGWPLDLIRKMADRLIELGEARKLSEKHEARWFNLSGFCLRPGFGDSRDNWRIGNIRKIYHQGSAFPDDEQCQAEWMVLWRRVAAGFTRGQQMELFNRIAPQLIVNQLGGKRRKRFNPQVEREMWRTAASLEMVQGVEKVELGDALVARIKSGVVGENELWSLGRIGARIPFASTIDTVVSAKVATRWVEALLGVETTAIDALASSLVQLAACSGDPARDLSEATRMRVIEHLKVLGKQVDLIKNLESYVPAERRDANRIFGESLPEGLRLIH